MVLTDECPRISVVLPVYNGLPYIKDAIASILLQDFADFELIVINDGSTDGTDKVLDEFDDPRLRVIHQANMGLALTLNRGLEMSRGEYIARQDADDISLPSRLGKQIVYMDQHPDCALVGSWTTIWEVDKPTSRGHSHPCDNGEIQIRLLFDSFFVHSSVMIRKSALKLSGLYPTDPERNPPEDFDLWLRIAKHFRVANIPEKLLIYREVASSISRTKADLLQTRAIKIAAENIGYILGDQRENADLHNLVAVLRHAPNYVTPNCNYKKLSKLLARIEASLVARFPQDAAEIGRGASELRGVLIKQNLKRRFLGKAVAKIVHSFGKHR